jgi:hypothetical protein
VRQLPQQQARQNDTQRRDGMRIMPLWALATSAAENPQLILDKADRCVCAQGQASRVGGSPALARGQ